ncbi:MAG: molybdopterin-dependent oxidoreductase, partial [Gemmatimonadales bacterium]
NTTIDLRDNVVVRLRPRPNLEVNRHFICDTGRMNYRWMNRGDRIEAPLVRDGAGHVAVDWEVALSRLAGVVKDARGPAVLLASAAASTESLGLMKRLLSGRSLTAAVRIPQGEEAPLSGIPNLALRKERAPNGDGARLLGYSTDWGGALKAASTAGLVVLLDVVLTEAEATAVSGAAAVVVLGSLTGQELPGAQLVLPVTTVAEENGTFVNRDRRVQRYLQAKAPPGMARPAWWVAGEAAARAGSTEARPGSAEEAFASLEHLAPALSGLSYADLGLTGVVVGAGAPPEVGR